MKIYFLADTHFGCKGDNPQWLDDYVSYFDDVLIPYYKKNVKSDDILVHLGDVFDCRSAIGLNTITKVIYLFEKLSGIFNDIRIVVGNHDIYQKHSNEITSLHMLRYIPNIRIYFEPTLENVGSKSVLFVPWIEDREEQRKLLKKHSVDYVFGHLEIGGCVTNSKGVVMKSNDSIKSTDFKKAQVYAGHIHIRQDYKNIHYVGNPFSKDRGDIGNIKGFTILDIETGKTEFIENSYSPKFLKYDIHNILDKTVGEIRNEWKNNYIDIDVSSGDVIYCNFEPLRENLKDCYKEFRLNTTSTDREILFKNEDPEIKIEAKSSTALVYEYLSTADVDKSVKDMATKLFNKLKEKV